MREVETLAYPSCQTGGATPCRHVRQCVLRTNCTDLCLRDIPRARCCKRYSVPPAHAPLCVQLVVTHAPYADISALRFAVRAFTQWHMYRETAPACMLHAHDPDHFPEPERCVALFDFVAHLKVRSDAMCEDSNVSADVFLAAWQCGMCQCAIGVDQADCMHRCVGEHSHIHLRVACSR